MNRQLIAGHTHLYTESSLDWMASEFKMEKVAEWWFGTDIVDLYRSIIIRLQQEFTGISMQDKWTETLLSVIDNLQRVLDEHHLSSEVHLLYRLGT